MPVLIEVNEIREHELRQEAERKILECFDGKEVRQDWKFWIYTPVPGAASYRVVMEAPGSRRQRLVFENGECLSKAVRDMRSELMFQQILEAAPIAMVVANGEGIITVVNTEVEKVFGYLREELLGQKVEMLMPERYRGRHPRYRADFSTLPAVRPMGIGLDLYGRRKDGSEFLAEISLTPVDTDEGTLTVSAIRNVSEQPHAHASEGILDEASVPDLETLHVGAGKSRNSRTE